MRNTRSIGTRLLIAAGALVVAWGATQVATQKNEAVPDADTLATALVPSTSAAAVPTSTPPPLPPGFPSMDRHPPKIEVPEGEPQPIATKFGLTYDIPADWENFDGGVAGWSGNSEIITYGAPGFYGVDACPEAGDANWRAMTGVSARRGMDLTTAAADEAGKIERSLADAEAPDMRFQHSAPVETEINGRPALRTTITVTGLPQEAACEPPKVTYDVVATPALATANVMLLVIQNSRDVPDAADQATVEEIINTLRPS
ncbi:hypothetical protein [Rhodococcus gannanensis]|uniref:DUF8017 domain-containing protein n=1 Tax=Rhodococcus gannanensis TaxID=1960308 RepID=A0ABW4PB82_9NOCA